MKPKVMALIFGFLGANLFLVPVELAVVYIGAILSIFVAIGWTWLWIKFAIWARFYTEGLATYSIGSGIGIVINLLYVAPFIGFVVPV